MKYFHHYLVNRPFTILTDHKSLQWILKSKPNDLNSRLTHRSLKLNEYNFHVGYKQGSKHTNADALSRLPIKEVNLLLGEEEMNIESPHYTTEIKAIHCYNIESESNQTQESLLDLIAKEQKRDDFSNKLIDQIQSTIPNRDGNLIVGSFTVRNDLLYRITAENRLQLYVPKKYRQLILESCHDSITAGHLSATKTWYLIPEEDIFANQLIAEFELKKKNQLQ